MRRNNMFFPLDNKGSNVWFIQKFNLEYSRKFTAAGPTVLWLQPPQSAFKTLRSCLTTYFDWNVHTVIRQSCFLCVNTISKVWKVSIKPPLSSVPSRSCHLRRCRFSETFVSKISRSSCQSVSQSFRSAARLFEAGFAFYLCVCACVHVRVLESGKINQFQKS